MQKREAESQHKPVYKVNGKSKSNPKGKVGNAHPSQKKITSKAETQPIKLDPDFTTNLMKQYIHTELKKTKKVEPEKKKPSQSKAKAVAGMTTPKKKKPKLTEEQKMINYLDPKQIRKAFNEALAKTIQENKMKAMQAKMRNNAKVMSKT